MTRRRAVDWVLIVALTASWAVLTVRAVADGLRDGRAFVYFAAASASTADAFPTVKRGIGRPSALTAHDEIRAVDGSSVRGASALGLYDRVTAAVRAHGFATVQVLRAGLLLDVRLEPAPASAWWIGVLCFSALFGSGAFLLLRAPAWHLARRYALATWCFAAGRIAVPEVGPPLMSFFEATFLHATWGLAAILTVWNAQDFTEQARPVPRWLRTFALLPGLLYGLTYAVRYFWTTHTTRTSDLLLLAAIVAMAAGSLAGLTRAYRRSGALERRQIRWVVLGFYVALVGTAVAATVLVFPIIPRESVRYGSALPLLAIPLGMTVSVVGYRWLDVDRWISASASYTIVGVAALGASLALAPRVASAAAPALGVDAAVVQWLFTMGLVLAAVPAHLALRPRLERGMFAEHGRRIAALERLVDEARGCSGAEELWKLASAGIDRALEPESLVVYAREGDVFAARFARGRDLAAPFAGESLLVQALERRARPLAADASELDAFDRAAFETLGVALIVPIHAGERMIAFACLGKKRSGDIYTREEMAHLAALAARCGAVVRPAAAPPAQIFRREGELWTIASRGKQIHLRDMRGLHYLATLLREPAREFPALGLVHAASGLAGTNGAADPELRVVRQLGDVGAVLDAQARAEYRERVAALDEELADAERCADLGRLERASEEREALLAELEATSRGARPGSDAERARVAVTKAIKLALEKIAEAHPELGAHLAATVRRGYVCAYEPDPRSASDWEV